MTATARKGGADVAGGRLALNSRVMNFLQGWLTHHIVSSDRHYAPFALAADRNFVIPQSAGLTPAV